MHPWLVSSRNLLRRRHFVGLLFATAALGLAFSFVSPFLSMWGTGEIGLTPVWFSAFMTVVTLSAIAVSTVLARWSDSHTSRRTMLLAGSAAGVLGYAGYALLRNPVALVFWGLTFVALSSVCFSQLFAHVREEFSSEGESGDATIVMSIVRVCFSVAWTFGPAVAATTLAHLGFRGLFFGAAGLYLAFFVGVARFVPHHPPQPGLESHGREPIWRVLSRRDLLACFLAFALVFAAHALNMMNLPLLITRQLGGTPGDLGVAFIIGPIAEIPLMLWFGQLAATGGRLRLIRFGVVATALYFVGLSCAREPWHIFPIQILSGVSFAILTNVAISFFQDLLPGQAGLATTVYSNAGNAGNLAGYFSFGGLVSVLGHGGAPFACAAACVAAFVLLLAVPAHAEKGALRPHLATGA
ncbi:MFS transporter [Opitutaceae bacterium EW11]|nr:MFS transporter [Opitutaceae bacterium EW11]